MALIFSAAALLGAAIFAIACAAAGHRFFRILRLEFDNELERLLCSIALGVNAYAVLLAALEFTGRVRTAVFTALAALAVATASELPSVWRELSSLVPKWQKPKWRKEDRLAAAIAVVLCFQAFAAVAPLTGSDALRYHFTAPMLVLREGFHPNFSLAHSSFTGQGHLLILTGLALGSEKFSLALVFLGGVLSAAACICLARKWATRGWACLAGLTFLLTPVGFWQISASGAPDIWMAFFAVTAVLFVARFAEDSRLAVALVAAVPAGALAGTKYTGCIFTAVVAIAFAVEARSLRRFAVFCCGAVAVGLWPYLRNMLWTGDPVFPFLMRTIAPERVNSAALNSIVADTGAAAHHRLLQVLQFPFFSGIDPAHAGFWQFFGPLVLVLAPLLVFAFRNTPLWRAALMVWILGAVIVGATSGMLRFLLPVWPIALAAVFAGAASLRAEWKIARAISFATIAIFLTACAGGLLLYDSPAVAATLGLTSRENYLRRRAPDYGRVAFVNESLRGQGSACKTLAFIRHLYYLQAPFLSGEPGENWSVDPQRLNSPEAWREFLRQNDICWVVRAPDYPSSIAGPLLALEQQGELQPFARGQVSDFAGMRIFDVRSTIPIVILRVKP